ncbi:hypothetical protein SAMN05421867_10132 [Cellulomonas marina]|uniref:Glycosyltransferase 2-like domain-containing protein n=1 Tax=Cellulomonas marina TaxID=988821 RepID=A0A1I0UZ61_9CELL|nr:hypothetical protein SAMN05421867_10132 [Cellulomonas marina]
MRAVVVTWNGAHLLPACLDSLLAQHVPGGMETLVVDNGSTDGTVALLAERYPTVTVVEAGRNLGFAGGAARGTEGFDGEFVVLLNNDARFEPGAVAALVAHARRPGAERVGAVTATVLLDEDRRPPRVNSTGLEVTRRGTGQDRDWLVPRGQESRAEQVFGFCGAAALLRVAALREVGTFDPWLFLYYEDTDLSWRLRAAGWDVHHEPAAVALHRHAASSDAGSPLFRYQNTRNSLVVVGRHAPAAVLARSWGRQVLGAVRAALAAGLRDPLVRARVRGLRDAARRLPRTLQERRRIWAGAAVPRAEVARLLVAPPRGGRA